MKEFSVVVTTFLHGKYVRSALESVINQTFKDFELIVIDDGSPDNTREEVAKVNDNRLRYIRQKPSGLPAYSRNRGIELASGRLVALFDGDDTWRPDKLERCLEIFNRDPSVDILCHDLDLIRENGKLLKRKSFGPYRGDVYTELLLNGNSLGISATVMKRSIFSEDNYIFSEDRRLFTVEDYDLWLRLAKARRYNFSYFPEVLGEHRVFESSASLANIEKNASNMLFLLDENLKELDTGNKRLRKIIKKKKSQVSFGAAIALNYRKKFPESVRWHLKTIKEYPSYLKPYLTLLASLCRINMGYL